MKLGDIERTITDKEDEIFVSVDDKLYPIEKIGYMLLAGKSGQELGVTCGYVIKAKTVS